MATTEERIAQIAQGFGQGIQNFQVGQDRQRAQTLQDTARRRQEALQALEVSNQLSQQTGRQIDPAAIQPFLQSGDLSGINDILSSGEMTPQATQRQSDRERQLQMQDLDMKLKQDALNRQSQVSNMDMQLKNAQLKEAGLPFDQTREAQKLAYQEGLKNNTSMRELNAPGYEIPKNSSVRPGETEAKSFRDALSNADAFKRNIKQVEDSIMEHGGVPSSTFSPNAHKDMQQKITSAMLDLKGEAFYKLGVLAGPDMELINKSFGDIDSLLSTWQPGSKKLALQKLQQVKNYVDNKIKSKADSLGYVKTKNKQDDNLNTSPPWRFSIPGVPEAQADDLMETAKRTPLEQKKAALRGLK